MIVRRVALSDDVKRELEPSLEASAWDWDEIERWIAAGVAAVWQIGSDAWAITAANADDEIDVIVGGGKGANRATRPFLQAMENLPVHRGLTLRIEGRRGWRRWCKDWHCEEAGGDVILTKRL